MKRPKLILSFGLLLSIQLLLAGCEHPLNPDFMTNRVGDIYVINADGTGHTNLTQNLAYDGAPSWSPDGTRIAFLSNRAGDFDLYVMNSDGSNQRRLTRNMDFNVVTITPAVLLSWSPDGSKIAFNTSRKDPSNAIYVINPDGSNLRRLTDNSFISRNPLWSPDGRQILFVGLAGDGEIYIMDAGGSNQRMLTDRSHYYPAWSPDGTRVVFSKLSPDSSLGVYVMDADGKNEQRLTTSYDISPSWSPDGTKMHLPVPLQMLSLLSMQTAPTCSAYRKSMYDYCILQRGLPMETNFYSRPAGVLMLSIPMVLNK